MVKQEPSSLVGDDTENEGSVTRVTDRLSKVWWQIPRIVRPVLSKNEQESLLLIESSYAAVLQQVHLALSPLSSRVSSEGKLLANFPSRISRLLSSSIDDFNTRLSLLSSSSSTLSNRITRTKQLKEIILTTAAKLLEDQVRIKENEILKAFHKDLVFAYQRGAFGSSTSLEEESTGG
jgi:hypothetical protein